MQKSAQLPLNILQWFGEWQKVQQTENLDKYAMSINIHVSIKYLGY